LYSNEEATSTSICHQLPILPILTHI